MRALRPRESARHGVQLALTELTQGCVQLLDSEMSKQLTDGAVHEIRTRVKRVRALLKLVRADMGEAQYRRANRRLRQISRSLARVRDAKIMLTTCQKLLKHRGPTDRAQYSLPMRRRLKAAREKISRPERRAMALKMMTVQKAIASWPESDAGWKVLSKGLRREYAHAQDAFETARLAPNDASLHELRKRSKALLYMCEFLELMSPHADSKARQLKRFAACLGTVHDLAVLIRAVRSEHIERLAARKQIALREKSSELGACIYRESPGTFTQQVHEDWRRHR